MAQDLIDKIREQAQARGLDPETAVRIAQAESSLDPSAKAKTSSAQGLFQVVDKTWKDFGGKPGKKSDVDENIRVGLNILESNTKSLKNALGRDPSPTELYAAHFLGATGAKTLLTAAPDTPVSQLLSQRAIKANPSMLKDKNVEQLMGILNTKMGAPAAAVAAAPTKAQAPMPAAAAGAPKRAGAPAAPVISKTQDLGAGYQAALALSFLGDEDEEGPLTREQWQERQDRTSSAQMLADYKPKNTLQDINWDESALFPAQPVKMADGGDVDLERVQSEARQGEAYRQMEQYLRSREAMPDIVAKKLPEPINAQFTALRMPVGSGTIELHKDPDVLRVIGPSVMAHELAHAAERQMGQQASEESSVLGGKSQFAEAYDKLVGRGPFVSGKKRAEFAQKIAPDWASFNREYRASPVEIGAHGVGAFAPSKNMQDSAPLHVDATAATEFQILLDLAQRNAKNRATGAARIPNFLKQVMGFAEGGEVEPTPEELAAAARPAFVTSKSGIGRKISTKPGEIDSAIVQGISEMPYNLVGSVADVGALALRPFGYTNPAPFMGSEWLKQQATRAGIRQAPPEQPTARAFYELSQLGSSLVNPAAPVRGAVAAGQAAGRTARQAMQDFQGYNRQLTVPSASYAVKPKGGEFTMEPGGRDLPRIDSVEYYLRNEIGTRGDNALDQWVTDKLGRYMRRDMASPDDQFVKAAEQGRPLHFMPDRQPVVSTGTEPDFLKYVRQSEGFNPKGEATTPYGRAVETQVDLAVEPVRLEDLAGSERRLRPQTAAEISTNPERRVYEVMAPEVNDRLQFPELVTAIQNIRENNVFRAYGQSVPIPKEFQFPDAAFMGLSPAQASERVAAYNKWTEGARQKAASEAITKNPRIETVKIGEGNTWVRVPDTAENPEIIDLVKDVGCAGGWCTKTEDYAISEGSGANRLHILMDKKAQPRAQLTLTERQINPDEFLNSMDDAQFEAFKAKYPSAVRYSDVSGTPEYEEWLRRNPPGYKITELKGMNNEIDLKKSPALPAIQAYIKQLDKEGNLQGVSNLSGINMMERDGLDIYNALVERYAALPQGAHKPFLEQVEARAPNNSYKGTFTTLLEQARALIDQKNGGSRYIVREDGPRLLKETLDEIFSPLEKANGGMVERRIDDSRKYL